MPFYYEQPLTTLIFQLKFYEQLSSLNFFNHFLVQRIKDRQTPLPQVLIPVPLHKYQMRKRGYNQALELAKRLSSDLMLKLDRHSCKRVKMTQLQQNLNAKQRLINVANAFTLQSGFSYQHAAVVDDVMTTGSTANEIAKLLKKQGVRVVEVWCCART